MFEVQTRNASELTSEDIGQLYDLAEGPTGETQAEQLLKEACQKALVHFEITPSYGAICTALAQSVEIIEWEEWLKQYCKAIVSKVD